MNESSEELHTVATAEGSLRGRTEGAVVAFRGVRYASPPIGALRFLPPQALPAWSGHRDALADGPIAPQGRSRLAHVMGEFERPQSEDCLTLTIWTPAPDAGARTVMVWFHGGAYMSGAGSLAWYGGQALADRGNLVVVCVNYRLGALGFLRLRGVADGNMGILDQVEALRWVQRNIHAFGGDPQKVTVFGQSAGGASIAAMMAMPAAQGLFRHAILQSPGMGRPTRPAAEADALGERYREFVGLPRDAGSDAMRAVPVARLLAAQGELARSLHTPTFSSLPFMPVVDGRAIDRPVTETLESGGGAAVRMMIGTTREEMAAFYYNDPAIGKADEGMLRRLFEMTLGEHHAAHLAQYRRQRASSSPAAILGDLMSDSVFRQGSLRLAQRRAEHGNPAWVYQFDWQSPAGFEACHCLEIPFVFGNWQSWAQSPMLQGISPAEQDGLTLAMQDAWIAFARTGDPNHDALPEWPVYEGDSRSTMRFDRVVGPVDDLAGVRRHLPWPESAP